MQSQYQRLTDPQWESIKEYLPVQRKRKYALRDMVDAIFWILRVGSQWRNLSESFPNWESVYYYFRKWKADSTLENLNLALNRLERKGIGKASTSSLFCIAGRLRDLQSIKSAPFVKECKGIDGNKMINGRKMHVSLQWSYYFLSHYTIMFIC